VSNRPAVCISMMTTLFLLAISACSGTPSPDTPASPGTPTEAELASISGTVLYESDDPNLRVYAREVTTGQVGWVSTVEGGQTYTIADLQPGRYVVVGWFYALGASGAYTSLDTVVAEGEAQMCACEDAIVEIDLQPGEAYQGADIGCWGGDFFGLAE
jgi:hypothetical protein